MSQTRSILIAAASFGTWQSLAHAQTVMTSPVYNPATGHRYILLTASTWTNAEAAAVNLGDDVPEAEKAARLAELIDLGDGMRRQLMSDQVGTHQQVLFEGRGKTGALRGRTERSEIVHAAGPETLIGTSCEVVISGCYKNSLLGEIPGVAAEGPAPRAPLPRAAGALRSLPVVPS